MTRKFLRSCGAQITIAILGGLACAAAFGSAAHPVSQKGRQFHPGEIAIKRGDAIIFVNDDGELLHHAYLATDSFEFDTGDQQPGSSVRVDFPVAGTFTVLCGIHPKMKLRVTVSE